MSADQDPRQDQPVSRIADPTRDIRLPPLPGRPAPDVPPGWAAPQPAAQPAAQQPAAHEPAAPPASQPATHSPAAQPTAAHSPAAQPPAAQEPPAPPVDGRPEGTLAEPPAVEHPTDRMSAPPVQSTDRAPTLTFSGTSAQRWAAGHGATPDPAWSSVPAAPGPVVVAPRTRSSRRWVWIVLAVLPVLVIAGTGVWLLLLMG